MALVTSWVPVAYGQGPELQAWGSTGRAALDLPLALARCRREQLPVVLGREVARQQAHRRQAEGTPTEHWQDHGEPPRRPRRFDAVVRSRLGEMKDGAASGKEDEKPAAR